MMSKLESALALAAKGFKVFPLHPKGKTPIFTGWQESATDDVAAVARVWGRHPNANIGIFTGSYKDEALVVVDVDNKGKKNGSKEVVRLEIEGKEFPKTYTQHTPTGGLHFVYRVSAPLQQRANALGDGLDTRSDGGYIVGAGSSMDGFNTDPYYRGDDAEIAPAPQWLVEACGRSEPREQQAAPKNVDQERAISRAYYYLSTEAPLALQGEGGDETTFKVACRVKDFGVGEKEAVKLLLEHWNERCSPPWEPGELKSKVRNAYRYGLEPVGASSPEADFGSIGDSSQQPGRTSKTGDGGKRHPFEELNKEYAFVVAGGGSHILWETKDHDGIDSLEHLGIPSFHQKLAAMTLMMGDGKVRPVSELWMRSPDRRSYDGIVFRPGLKVSKRFYNLWRGFAVEPADLTETQSADAINSLEMFVNHAKDNVCRGDEALFKWLMGYFAHIMQKPWEKPLTALVFRGGKGVGKNALIDRIGSLLGSHYLLTSNKRYLTGNFNGHLENCLFFALDEAFWSGDKQAEGTLKDLITGTKHVIEHKGKEPFKVDNCTRVCIIGNEEWLVPATQDERRFAVFDVGDGRKQDRNYFSAMRQGMERGGYRLLLRYLLDFDLKGIDLNAAPNTQALMDQKVSSLEPFHQWWLDCLLDGRVVASEFGGEWQLTISKESFRNAFRRYVKERQIRSRIPEDRQLGKLLKACCPVDASGKRREGGELINLYRLPPLIEARAAWSKYIGHQVEWEK